MTPRPTRVGAPPYGRAVTSRPGTGRLTGLVVGGAGARGAYEAGALSVLVPRLAADDGVPPIMVGTSAGALNVVGLAGLLHLGVNAALDALVALWGAVRLGDVVDVAGTLAGGLSYAGRVVGLPTRLPSLLDTSPQRATLERLLDLDRVHEAVRSGPVDALAVVTTSVHTGGTVVFVERKQGVALPPPDADRAITYVDTELTVEHVLASAAVPAAFAPVLVTTPAAWAGWYVDGGLRLNVPLKPALDLGAERLGVVSTQPSSYGTQAPGPVGRTPDVQPPDVAAVAALALRSLLADRMVEDLRVLSTVNRLVAAGATGTGDREVPFMFAGPGPGQGRDLARLASTSYREAYGGAKALRQPALAVLERLLGGSSDDNGELLSYLFFDPAFTVAAAALGAAQASAAGPGWRTNSRA